MSSPLIINNGKYSHLGTGTLGVNSIQAFSDSSVSIGISSDTVNFTGNSVSIRNSTNVPTISIEPLDSTSSGVGVTTSSDSHVGISVFSSSGNGIEIKSNSVSAITGKSLNISGGNSSSTVSGNLNLFSNSAIGFNTGNIMIFTGIASGSVDAGSIHIYTGIGQGGDQSGGIVLESVGGSTVTPVDGQIDLVSENTVITSTNTYIKADVGGSSGGMIIQAGGGGTLPFTSGEILIYGNDSIVFATNGSAAISINDDSDPSLVGFTSTSIVGALNEIKKTPIGPDTEFSPAGLWITNGTDLSDASGNGLTLSQTSPLAHKIPGPIFGIPSHYFFASEGHYLTHAHAPSLTLLGELTISLWVNVETAGSGGALIVYSGPQASSSEADNTLYYLIYTGGIVTYMHEGASGTQYIYNFDAMLPANSWTHVVITRDSAGTGIKCYLNGTLYDSTTLAGAPVGGSNATLAIGDLPEGGFPHAGGLYGVQIIASELSDEDILAEYRKTAPLGFTS